MFILVLIVRLDKYLTRVAPLKTENQNKTVQTSSPPLAFLDYIDRLLVDRFVRKTSFNLIRVDLSH